MLPCFNANTPPEGDAVVAMQTRQVMQEFWSRFRDGVFHLTADKQFEEAGVKIEGGYLKPYENVLFYNEFDQKKSIVAIKHVVPFFKKPARSPRMW